MDTCWFHSGAEIRLTDEHKERIRQAQSAKNSFKGRRHTPETRALMSEKASGQRRGSQAHAWKGGRVTHKGYIYLYAQDHPSANKRGYVLEHRLVVEESLGRLLEADEHVHHINEIKDDNRLENLMLMAPGEHVAHHRHEEFKRYGVGNFSRKRKP